MEAPRISGYTHDGRRYQVTARSAVQDLKKLDLFELMDLKGEWQAPDLTPVTVVAASGLYNTKLETITLGQRIVLTTSSGFEAHLSEATIETRNGKVTSNRPVEVRLPDGLVNANRLEITENGERIQFLSGVTMTLNRTSAMRGAFLEK